MSSQIILLERVDNLGEMGDVVSVKPGFARNYLLPQGKALRATKENVAYFEEQKKTIKADSDKRKKEAEAISKRMDGLKVTLIRQAAEAGQLFGSVTARDIADAVNEQGFNVERNQVQLNQNFKMIGLFEVDVVLHPEVKTLVTINIARSQEEAEVQAKTCKALIAGNEDDEPKQTRREKADERSEEMKQDMLEDSALEAEEEAKRLAEAEAEKTRKAAEKKEAAKAEAAAEEAGDGEDDAETAEKE